MRRLIKTGSEIKTLHYSPLLYSHDEQPAEGLINTSYSELWELLMLGTIQHSDFILNVSKINKKLRTNCGLDTFGL